MTAWQAKHRRVVLRVYVDGVRVDASSVRMTYSLDQKIPTASFRVPESPIAGARWTPVQIECGTEEGLVTDRFAGYIDQVTQENYPHGTEVACRGKLMRAERTLAELDTTDLDIPGIDMSNAGAGMTDSAMVDYGLSLLGYTNGAGNLTAPYDYVYGDPTPAYDTVAGWGITFGTIAKTKFVWDRNQSLLGFIDGLSKAAITCRLFETLNGQIFYMPIWPYPNTVADFTFVEGYDLKPSGKASKSLHEAKNRWVITGYDAGKGPLRYVATGVHPNPPPGITVVPDTYDSPMIERLLDASPGLGMSCETVGTNLLALKNAVYSRVTFTTWRDDLLGVGQTVGVSAVTRLGVDQKYWLNDLTIEVTQDGAFQQTLGCIGPDVLSP